MSPDPSLATTACHPRIAVCRPRYRECSLTPDGQFSGIKEAAGQEPPQLRKLR